MVRQQVRVGRNPKSESQGDRGEVPDEFWCVAGEEGTEPTDDDQDEIDDDKNDSDDREREDQEDAQ